MKGYFTIHQTSFIPYIGFWAKIDKADVFIMETADLFSTTSMYYRTYYTNQKNELMYLTIPIKRDPVPLYNVELKNKGVIRDKIFNAFFSQKIESPYFKPIKEEFSEILNSIHLCNTLHEINMIFYNWIANYLNINTKLEIVKPGDIVYDEHMSKTEKLVKKIKTFGCEDKIYISGSLGKNYIEDDIMSKHNIEYVFQKPKKEFYKGSIMHYILRYHPDEIRKIMQESFDFSR